MPARPDSPAGVILANLGTPDAPTATAVRRYLREFLSDPRVVEAPRLLWWLVSRLVILPFRPSRSARKYRRIWTDAGSPLLTISRAQATAVQETLDIRLAATVPVFVGMRYGAPAIASALRELRRLGCVRVLLLPLYPQYSATTTASAMDALGQALVHLRRVPEVRTVNDYHDHPAYIRAVAASIRKYWELHGTPERLLMSFHGLPRRYADAGDPYPEQCARSAGLIAAELALEPGQWRIAYQSRFGREEWLRPYTDLQLRSWGEQGMGSVDVVCPGFASDCVETLEEIAITNRELFESSGGGRFRYIPALNDTRDHVDAITEIALQNLQGWI